MGSPQEPGGAAAYEQASVLTHCGRIQGRLLLVHGLLDENVHARHSLALAARLARHNEPFEFLPLASERHVPRDPQTKAFMERRVRDFLLRWLKGPL